MKLKRDKSQSKKYRIDEILQQKTFAEYKTLKKELPDALGITRQTFYLYLNATIDDGVEIPATKLFILSKYLGVEISELYNNEYFNKVADEKLNSST